MSAEINIDGIFEAYEKVLEHSAPDVLYFQIRLGDIRSRPPANMREDIKAFLDRYVEMHGDAIVVITALSVTFLVNDEGNLLSFA